VDNNKKAKRFDITESRKALCCSKPSG